MEETSGLFVKSQRGRSKSRGSKRDPKASNSFSYYFCKKSRHIKKSYMKYKKMLKRKGDKDSNGASTSGKSDQTGIVEEADENSCDVLTAESGKGKYLDLGYLTQGAHITCAQKESGLVLTSLMMEALSDGKRRRV